MDTVYEWANDPATRAASFNTAEIPYETHVRWFSKVLDSDDVILFILMDDNESVGQIRLDIDGGDAEISYSISPQYRGKGYARIMLRLLKREVEENYRYIDSLIAKVKPDNDKSLKLFETEGYKKEYCCFTIKTTE